MAAHKFNFLHTIHNTNEKTGFFFILSIETMAAARLFCGRGLGVALQPSPSGTCGTLPVHRWVGSG